MMEMPSPQQLIDRATQIAKIDPLLASIVIRNSGVKSYEELDTLIAGKCPAQLWLDHRGAV